MFSRSMYFELCYGHVYIASADIAQCTSKLNNYVEFVILFHISATNFNQKGVLDQFLANIQSSLYFCYVPEIGSSLLL